MAEKAETEKAEKKAEKAEKAAEKAVEEEVEKAVAKPALEEEAEKAVAKPAFERRAPPNVIFIGRKPLMNYVIGAILQFNQGAEFITVKARGKAISRAVDVVEIVKRRFLGGETKVGDIKIGTEMLGEGDDMRNVSTIEITVKKAS